MTTLAPQSAPPFRIACVRYLNTLPLIEGVGALPGVELIPAAPSHIEGLVRSGGAELGLVSLIDGPGNGSEEPLVIVPAGVIGCDGPTHTVRLFSRVPMERVTRVHADTESHTSVALAQVVLAERFGVRPEIVAFDAREGVEADGGRAPAQPETVLLIGDKVVTDTPSSEVYTEQLDLGLAWREMTGLPFVYAAWMCRAETARGDARLRGVASLLDRQRRHNRMRLDWLVAKNAPAFHWPLDTAREYIGRLLRYEPDERAWAGARLFLEKASALGLCPAWEPEVYSLREAMTV